MIANILQDSDLINMLLIGGFACTTFAIIYIVILEPLFKRSEQIEKLQHTIMSERRTMMQQYKRKTEQEKRKLQDTLWRHLVAKLLAHIQQKVNLEEYRMLLMRAGIRAPNALAIYWAMRLVMPVIVSSSVGIWVFVLNPESTMTNGMKILLTIAGAGFGFYLPKLLIVNRIQKRQEELKRFFPDTLDFLLITIEAGMSIEASMNKLITEIGRQSVVVAEEISLTAAELTFLSERRIAYENMAKRIDLPSYKSLAVACIQCEKYGTSIGRALRVLAQENRETAIQEVERRAAALPAKMTIPMVLFFLPVLFAVIMGPAVIQVMNQF